MMKWAVELWGADRLTGFPLDEFAHDPGWRSARKREILSISLRELNTTVNFFVIEKEMAIAIT